ncbi:protein MAINTENANCE OF MERISTEMS-like [Apium graveolens]|uniref:protein MAINTENANCE OF MERISTEMS-like n=1 Tax=Apium graveolens TaxID=4045 RepID=UPI003D7B3786
MQDDHISTVIWARGVQDRLDVRQYRANYHQWILSDPQRELLRLWGFSAFTNNCSVSQNDIRLITALVEMWRPETNTFHFPFGELTITLEDVYMIMGLHVKGRPVTHRELDAPKAYLQLIQDLPRIKSYAWGAAVLSYLFRGLTKAAHKSTIALNGCTMLLILWAHERLLPGAPKITPGVELVWPMALAWAEPNPDRRENPHHHTGQYRGDFDRFEMS